MTIFELLRELRKRLLWSVITIFLCSIVAFLGFDIIFKFLSRPFSVLNASSSAPVLYVTSIFEGFFTKLKASIIFGILLSFPLHLYNIISFIFPGLRSKERKLLIAVLISGLALVVFSIYLCYGKLLPLSIQFLTSKDFIPHEVGRVFHYDKSLLYVLNFLLYAMIIFQLPIVLELLLFFNLFDRRRLLCSS